MSKFSKAKNRKKKARVQSAVTQPMTIIIKNTTNFVINNLNGKRREKSNRGIFRILN